MNQNIQVCQVCKANISLSRREISAIAAAVKGIAKNRYFVPDDEVHAIIHRIHSQKVEEQKR